MSLWTPPQQFAGWQSNQGTASAPWTTVTASATPHTKGAYAQIFASLDFDVFWIEIILHGAAAAGVDTGILVDIAIGAAASEMVIIPNINSGFGYSSLEASGQKYVFPLYIPAGSRLSARSQAVVVSDTIHVSVRVCGKPKGPVWAGTKVIDYGTVGASSQGTTVAAGVSNAEGAWTQIVAATTQGHSFLSAGLAGLDNVVQQTDLLLDIGIGAAAAEVAISENNHFTGSSSEWIIQTVPIAIWRSVPAGTRLAARISQGSASAKSYDVILYGLS